MSNPYFEYRRPYYIYVMTNIKNGKKYVGCSERPKWRFKEHLAALKHNRHKVEDLQADYEKYGEDAFIYCLVDVKTERGPQGEEYKWMKELKTYDRNYGYNYKDIVMKPVIREMMEGIS